jgi:hypothetical protein
LISVTVTIDAHQMTPAEAADWLAAFDTLRAAATAASRQATTDDGQADDPLERQLRRLTDFSPSFASRVRWVHGQLVLLGYVATLPDPRKSARLPSYISYVDPATGANLGNLNSQKFYVMRRPLRDVLKGQPHVEVDSRYANIALVDDDAASFLVELAKQQKAR